MAAIDSQTSSADEVTISTKTRSNEELTTRIRIQTIHDECYGLVDPEGEPPIGIAPQQIDENLRCETQDQQVDLGPLSEITMEELREAIEVVISKGGDHGIEAFVDRHFLSFDFVPAEEGKANETLFGVSDEDLQRILAGGKGFVQVVWYF